MKRLLGWWLASALVAGLGCSNGGTTPTEPEDTGVIPEDTGNPTDTGTPPTDTGNPTDTGTPPTDTGTPPEDTGTPPEDTGPPPEDTGTTPEDTSVPPDSLPPCEGTQTRCGETCVDLQANNANCGTCGNACPTGQLCRAGACVTDTPCPTGQSRCGTACVDTTTDTNNCGSCGNACPSGQSCVTGTCQTTTPCPTGQTRCGASCVDTQTDAANCGTCGTACAAGQTCTAGTCRATVTCPTGRTACGGTCVDLQTDPANCGACATACPTGQTCQTGTCRAMTCPTGQELCGTACANLQTDNANCGVCGRACATGQTCVAGACTGTVTCPAGQTRCGEACADLQTDPANCGACGTACAAGQSCTTGACRTSRPTCATGQTDCAPTAPTPTCVDLQTSNANCGACGTACPSGQTCTAGACACPTGQTRCDRACVNTQTDNANCGACGTVCPTGQTCTAGRCACATGQTLCSGACVNTATDRNHCGACGTVCPTGQTCTAGACACPTGQTRCGTGSTATCVNTQTDRNNCGACGTVCSTGQTCTAGRCACPTGQTLCGTGTAAACVDTQTSAAHCGRCANPCPSGVSCTAGVCRGTPPANDTRAGATLINLTNPSQTLAANTTSATNNTAGACRCAGGNDVFFRFVLSGPEVVYADTLGASWDTALFFQDSAGANLSTALSAAPNVTCNDDNAMSGLCPTHGTTGLQSQIVARLPAGTYYLVLSGCGAGAADIHFQHLPAGNGAAARITPGTAEQTVTGTTTGTGTVASSCCSGGPDNTYWWVTCPGAAAQTFYASTCSATTGANLAAYDVEVAQYSALRTTGAVCNDDNLFLCGTGSSMSSTIPATTAAQAGINTLIADSCTGSGAYTIRYVMAAPCSSGARCGASCVDTATDPNNCGGCDRRCAAGLACAAGACIPAPANDLPASAVTINMAVPQSTYTVDTRSAANNTSGSCACTTGRDVFYNFTIAAGASEIVYADTIGSNFDTSIFVQTRAGANITDSGLSDGQTCNDDGGLAGCALPAPGASQILLRLGPGDYRLVVSGCSSGTASVRFQHAPVGNGLLYTLASGSSTRTGATSGTGRVNLGCGGASAETTYYWYACPAYAGGSFTASTCGRVTWDTVLEQYSPARSTPGATVCADDSCGTQSSVTSTIPAGPGLHTLYVDGYSSNTGSYTVTVSRP